jgi:hydroxypyruvate reductase
MALGAHEALGDSIARTLVITKRGHLDPEVGAIPGVTALEAGHPIPDASSLRAGEVLREWTAALRGTERPLWLISGGASSLVEVLREGITLADLAQLNRDALAAGTPIGALNATRAALSHIKGGALIAQLDGRAGDALFLSDVPGDDPAVIGSGLLAPVPGDRIRRRVIANAERAIEAAAEALRARGARVWCAPERLAGDAATAGAHCVRTLQEADADACVWGGETTVQLPAAPGRGGRNQHLALAAALALRGERKSTVLAAGTDGDDGTTDDAGAIVDCGTCERILDAGLDAATCLARADSGTALEASGDLIHTGPTGTNVGDLVIGLRGML